MRRLPRIFSASALAGLLLAGAWSCEKNPGDEQRPTDFQMEASPAGWFHLFSASEPVTPADRFLSESRFIQALDGFSQQSHPLRRHLGLGQAHFGLGQLYFDLWPLALEMNRAFLRQLSQERELTPQEASILSALDRWMSPSKQSPSSPLPRVDPLSPWRSLEELSDEKLFQREDSQNLLSLLGQISSVPVLEIPSLGRIHLRLARLRLDAFCRECKQPRCCEQVQPFANEARVLEGRLNSLQPPIMGGDSSNSRRCIAQIFDLARAGQKPAALERLNRCAPSQDSEPLARLEPSWLLLRAWLRYHEGSCQGFALATMDLSMLEGSSPVFQKVVRTLRRLYAWECSGGGRMAGG